MMHQADSQAHSDDVAHLFAQYRKGPQRYHEIRLNDSMQAIRDRWPLLNDVDEQGASACD